MVGDQDDIVRRLKAVLPLRWFPDSAPILESLLAGIAAGWAVIFGLLTYVRSQTRLASATDVWLDVFALDFFGDGFSRRQGEGDLAYRSRISRELLRERGTRNAVISILEDLTGRTPIVLEPARITDTGAFSSLGDGSLGLAYGVVGAWGNLSLPFQAFVTAYRPWTSGIANVAGRGSGPGGYGVGAVEYGSLAWMEGQVTDASIYAAVAAVLPTGTIAWTRISN
jgi:hypothetical protein